VLALRSKRRAVLAEAQVTVSDGNPLDAARPRLSWFHRR